LRKDYPVWINPGFEDQKLPILPVISLKTLVKSGFLGIFSRNKTENILKKILYGY